MGQMRMTSILNKLYTILKNFASCKLPSIWGDLFVFNKVYSNVCLINSIVIPRLLPLVDRSWPSKLNRILKLGFCKEKSNFKICELPICLL